MDKAELQLIRDEIEHRFFKTPSICCWCEDGLGETSMQRQRKFGWNDAIETVVGWLDTKLDEK